MPITYKNATGEEAAPEQEVPDPVVGQDPHEMTSEGIVDEVAGIKAKFKTIEQRLKTAHGQYDDRLKALTEVLRARAGNLPPDETVIYRGSGKKGQAVRFARVPEKTVFLVSPKEAHFILGDVAFECMTLQIGLARDYLTKDQRDKVMGTEREGTRSMTVES